MVSKARERENDREERGYTVMTVATFPPCRKRIAPFPSDRKCGNKALPACGLKEVVTTSVSERARARAQKHSVTFQ